MFYCDTAFLLTSITVLLIHSICYEKFACRNIRPSSTGHESLSEEHEI